MICTPVLTIQFDRSASHVEGWLDRIANRVFYAYTTVKLLVQATKEKNASAHIEGHSQSLLSISELLVRVTWGWNESIRALKGFSNKWLRIDIDQELQDALLRSQPYFDALEASSERLIKANTSWEVFFAFCTWSKDVVTFAFFLLVELLHAFLLVAVAIIDLILDLLLDAEKRHECYTLFIQLIRWLHSQYFESGSVLTKTIFAAIKRIAPHLLAYVGRPYSYVIQAMAFILKGLARMADEQSGYGSLSQNSFISRITGASSSSLITPPAPLRVSAKVARKLLLKFRALALTLWEPIVTNVLLGDKNKNTAKAKL